MIAPNKQQSVLIEHERRADQRRRATHIIIWEPQVQTKPAQQNMRSNMRERATVRHDISEFRQSRRSCGGKQPGANTFVFQAYAVVGTKVAPIMQFDEDRQAKTRLDPTYDESPRQYHGGT